MFTNKIKILLGVSILMLGSIVAANAQIDNGGAVRFEVSHSFVVNGKTLPAGRYAITDADSLDGTSDVLALRSIDGKESMLFSTIQKNYNEPAKDTALVFEQVGDTYYLTEIRTKGEDVGIQVEELHSEKDAIASAASTN